MDQHFKPNSVAGRDVATHLHSQTNPKRFEENGPVVVTSLAPPQASPLSHQILYTFLFQLTYGFMQKALASNVFRQAINTTSVNSISRPRP